MRTKNGEFFFQGVTVALKGQCDFLSIMVPPGVTLKEKCRASDDGGAGGPWPLHFFAKYAIPEFVDNRLNSL